MSALSMLLTKFGTVSAVSGEDTLTRYGTSDQIAELSSVSPSEDEWNAAIAG